MRKPILLGKMEHSKGSGGCKTSVAKHSQFSEQKLQEIDEMNQELDNLQESLTNTKVRAHLLAVDLAVQFNPTNAKVWKRSLESCKKCRNTLSCIDVATASVVEKDVSETSMEQD